MSEPAGNTVERWAWDYIHSCDLVYKLGPPPVPDSWEQDPPCRLVTAPGRPAELTVTQRASKTPSPGALRSAARRAQLVHTFWHHELQAAELMCWAVLRFADTPRDFRRGLIGICRDEIRHMGMYRDYLADAGFAVGEFPVRDWFWLRVPSCTTATAFVATLGMGLEGGNLDHAHRFATQLRAAGDERGARLQERVGTEEVAHVRFALRWFERWTGSLDFATWREALPSPLSPLLMRGKPLNRADRQRAGMPDAFVAELDQYVGTP